MPPFLILVFDSSFEGKETTGFALGEQKFSYIINFTAPYISRLPIAPLRVTVSACSSACAFDHGHKLPDQFSCCERLDEHGDQTGICCSICPLWETGIISFGICLQDRTLKDFKLVSALELSRPSVRVPQTSSPYRWSLANMTFSSSVSPLTAHCYLFVQN